MAALQQVKAGLQRSHCPAVMVLAHPAVDAACTERNGLTLAELLRPFGVIRQLNGTVGVPVRTPAEHPLRLHSWRLRFYAADTMFQPAGEAADAYLQDVLTSAAQDAAGSDIPDLQELLQAAGSGRPECGSPWYQVYRREYLRLMQFGEHETLDHPVACVLALPADVEGDPVAAAAALWRHSALPPLMQGGVMESSWVLRHHVLVYDAAGMGPEVLAAAEEKLRYMASALGSTACQLITINSGSGAGCPAGAAPWAAVLAGSPMGGGGGEVSERVPPPPAGLGAWLSDADVSGLAGFVHDLAVRCIIPHMESRLRALNVQVTANRKGLRNQLKSLLWRKPAASSSGGGSGGATDSPHTPSTPAAAGAGGVSGGGGGVGGGAASLVSASYVPGSVESHMRQLSDLALMLGDYETAASTLRLLGSDTKADRAYKAYAGVQEALGAAAVLAGAPPPEAVACLKEAFYRYSQLSQANPRNREGTRYATRAAMLLAEYLRALGQQGDANWAFMKAHFQEENLRAGLLLEQAAHCLLSLSPPHTRKFAFHLVLAGLRFDMCGQKGLAQRAYKQVLGVYAGRRWALVEEHLHDALGRQARDAGDPAAALDHFVRLLDCPHSNLYCQKLFLSQFMDTLQAAQQQLGFAPTLELPLPLVNRERVGVQHDGQTCYSGVEARQVAPEVWRGLEAALSLGSAASTDGQAPGGGGGGTWLEGGSRARLAEAEAEAAASRTCCVGEPVGVDVELRNPLQVELAVTRLRLACSWEPPAAAAAAAAAATAGGGSGGAATPVAPAAAAAAAPAATVAATAAGPSTAAAGAPAAGVAAAAGAAGGTQPAGTAGGAGGAAAAAAASQDISQQGFQVQEESVTLRPGEKVVVHLRVVPLRPGMLQVHGVAWVLDGSAQAQASFCIPRPRPRKPGSSSKVLLDAERPAPGGLTLHVLPPMPRLEVWVLGLPSTMLAGEVVRCSMKLRNSGAMTLQHLSMAAAVSTGAAVFLGSGATGGSSTSADSAGGGSSSNGGTPRSSTSGTSGTPRGSGGGTPVHVPVELAPGFRQGAAVFTLPGVRLGVGQELTLPVWFRACHSGPACFMLAWRYEPLVRLDALAYRTVRCARIVQALPSLHLAVRLAAGLPGCLPGGALLQVQLHNLATDALTITALACPGSTAWRMVQPGGSGGAAEGSRLRVAADAAATMHRQLAPSEQQQQQQVAQQQHVVQGGQAVGGTAAGGAAGAGGIANIAGLLPGPGGALVAVMDSFMLEASRCWAAAAAPAAPKHLQPPANQQQQQQGPQQQQQQHKRQGQGQQKGKGKGEGMDVVLLWQAAVRGGGTPRYGFCCMHNQRLHPGPPIDARMSGPSTVRHNFAAAPVCLVSLTLQLRNGMAAPAAVCIELGKTPAGGSGSQAGIGGAAGTAGTAAGAGTMVPVGVPTWATAPPPSPAAATLAAAADGSSSQQQDASSQGQGQAQAGGSGPAGAGAPALPAVRQYMWCGRTRITLPAVPPGQVVEVQLQAAVSRPGKLALCDVMVSWHYAGPPHITGSAAVLPHHCSVVHV